MEQGTHLGDEDAALKWLRGTIDHADEVGVGSGRYGPHWYTPGTHEVCENGHAKPLDGPCGHSYCVGQQATVDARTEGFYVTVRDRAKVGFLLGPYATHDEARGEVGRARDEVLSRDPFGASFWSFGTVKATAKPGRELKPGKLNDVIGLTAGE
ncbi:hypothetical protein ABTY20_22875 [Streptomyces sp. NPDC126497]|uniref:hypothetical protein n=1 Tax=Streptomyces sp. NPDC126497 TaxID=3155313 RepID=UPI00331670E9